MPESVVLVTGASTSIGRAAANAFARQGHVVVVSARRFTDGEQLTADLQAAGAPAAAFVEADVRFDSEIEALVDSTRNRFGRLDVAVNTPETEGTPSPVVELNPELYSTVFDTDVLGTLLSMKHELRVMQEQGSGSIVNVTAAGGGRGYGGAKDAIVGLTRTAALEAASYGVRVNAIGPGRGDGAGFARDDDDAPAEDAFPHAHAGTPDEVGEAIAFIAGPEGAYLTGQAIFLDGSLKAG